MGPMFSVAVLPSLNEFRRQLLALDCHGQDRACIFEHLVADAKIK
jgi:hypothetical protein